MIEISFFENGKETYKVIAKGHSGYAESGSDIVCAAVSTLVQSTYLAVKDLGVDVDLARDDGVPLFEFGMEKESNNHDVQVLMRALRVGIEDLRSGYPKFITVKVINGGK